MILCSRDKRLKNNGMHTSRLTCKWGELIEENEHKLVKNSSTIPSNTLVEKSRNISSTQEDGWLPFGTLDV